MSNNCSNCYNGCTEITSDKCVKYTGVDVPVLGIKNGDSLSYVEQSIIGFLSSTLDGTGILPVINPSDVCPTVDKHLPDCDPISLNNWLTALLKALCALEDTVAEIPSANPATPYDVDCLTVTDNTNTIDVLQSVIYKVCDVAEQLNNFITYVDATYVKISDINTYIENYINGNPTQQLINQRMVPYSIVAATGGSAFLDNFSASGAGIGEWDRIFLCNGENGTPDLRGRVIVGTNDGSMGGGAMDAAVNPSSTNPTYTIGGTHGNNSVVLQTPQIPAHSHSTTVGPSTPTITPTGTAAGPYIGSNIGGGFKGGDNDFKLRPFVADPLPSHTHTVTVNPTGGGQGHQNYQPGRGVYYIIYIP